MQVGDRYFLLNIGVGITSQTMQSVQRHEKRLFGILSYLWKGFFQLLGFPIHTFKIRIDGRPTRFHATEVIVANCGNIGLKPFRIHPDINPDDGRVEVCRVRARNLIDYLKLGWGMLSGYKSNDRDIVCLDAEDEVKIDSERQLPVQGDGDLIADTPVVIKLNPHAVHIITPIDQAHRQRQKSQKH